MHRLGIEPLHVQFFRAREILRFGLIQNAVQLPFPDRVQHQPMLLAQLVLFLRVPEPGLGRLAGVGLGPFANAPAADKDLRLQQKIRLARLALHVVNRVLMLYVSVEAENHKLIS